MNTDNKYLKTVLAGVLTTALSAGLTGTALAQGAGGVEPGAGCATAFPGQSFTPIFGAPYKTKVTIVAAGPTQVTFSAEDASRMDGSDTMTISEQTVPSACEEVDDTLVCKSFEDLGRRDLQGFCVQNVENSFGTEFAEVLAVQSLTNDGITITADVLLLPIAIQ